jgi:membrane protein YdbS with pleckstrin-like domain
MADVYISKKKKTESIGKKHSPKVIKANSTTSKKVKSSISKHKISGHSHNPFSSYIYYPDRVKFINRDPKEKVVLLLRKHPITNLGWVLLTFAMVVAPAFITIFEFFELLPMSYQIIFVLIWYLITSAFAFEEFLSWFFHVNIITDERIIEVDFVNLFYREITDANIDQIQDVTVEVGGGIRTLMNFGDIVIQTASQIPKIDFEDIPEPDKVAKILRELRIEEEKEKLEGRIR